ncbi:MAG: CPBP family intramembrane metalloprotease [Acidobacteria bacterium]|nr:CPBP family intramembrane metalloprotease [Acidobacteriota bacterium]
MVGIIFFLLLTFLGSWALMGWVYALGGLQNPRAFFPGIAVAMLVPGTSAILTRWYLGEGFDDAGWKGRVPWHWYLGAYLFGVLFFGATYGLLLLLGWATWDPSFGSFLSQMRLRGIPFQAGQELRWRPLLFATLVTGPVATWAFALGEEMGWRGYLLLRLWRWGPRRALLVTGLIWGAWHLPMIWMGYNYPGYPVLGSLLMILYSVLLGIVLGWFMLRSGSVWIPALAHATVNAQGAGLLPKVALPDPWLMGGVLGWVGLCLLALVSAVLLRDPKITARAVPNESS